MIKGSLHGVFFKILQIASLLYFFSPVCNSSKVNFRDKKNPEILDYIVFRQKMRVMQIHTGNKYD